MTASSHAILAPRDLSRNLSLRFSASLFLLFAMLGGAGLAVSAADTDCGLTQEQPINLFQPFAQAGNSTTRKFSGGVLASAGGCGFPSITEAVMDLEQSAKTGETITTLNEQCRSLARLCSQACASVPKA